MRFWKGWALACWRAAIGMAVAAKSMQSPDVRRMARRAVRKMDHMKDDLADTLGL